MGSWGRCGKISVRDHKERLVIRMMRPLEVRRRLIGPYGQSITVSGHIGMGLSFTLRSSLLTRASAGIVMRDAARSATIREVKKDMDTIYSRCDSE